MSEKEVEEKSVFDEADVSEEIPTEGEVSPDVEEEEQGEWVPTVSKESPKEQLARKGIKADADGRIVTIKSTFFTRPKTKGFNGEPIAPKESTSGESKFYAGKLGIRFEEDNLVEYYPTFRYFVNDGVMSKVAKINRSESQPIEKRNAVWKILALAVAVMGKPMSEVSDQEFYDWLVGKKVKLKTDKGVWNNKPWFRNDIVEFVE